MTTMSWSQTDNQRQSIRASYDIKKLAELQAQAEKEYQTNQKEARDFALANSLPMIIQLDGGGVAILDQIINGNPVYLTTDNVGASQTTNTNQLQQGGSLGLDLEGQGMTLGIWDGGAVRPTHLGVAGRVVQMDSPAANSDHGTHVAGTMMGSRDFLAGQVTGMAPQAMLQANDFGDDFAEMIPQAANGLLVSNHSYGFGADNLPLYYFGAYDSASTRLDELLYSAPFYLMVCSAGNDRGDGHNSADGGYDIITDRSCAKNNITVAAVEEVTNYTGPEDVNMSSFSSWGPTDDGRIKPDISAKGVNMLSLGSSTDVTVGTKSGTSMATPNASGSLILLQQLYDEQYSGFMKAATMKAIALHTAREAGDAPGPDYRFGWGLLDMEAAAEVILDRDFFSSFSEQRLSNGASYEQTVTATGTEPLVVTVVWTDPAGEEQEEIVDDRTPRLVNDLDVRLTDSNGNVFMPWKLDVENPAAAATTGDNLVDNVEKIELSSASGEYTVTVTHKGTLVNDAQDFSIVITGINEGEYRLLSQVNDLKLCDTEDAVYNFNYEPAEGYNTETTFSLDGLPTGANLDISPESLTGSGNVTVSITNLSQVEQGIYLMTVRGSSAGLEKSFSISLEVVSTDAMDNAVLSSPQDNATEVTIYPELVWDAVPNAEVYTVEVSTADDFSSIAFQEDVATTSIQLSELNAETQYYWRVKPSNTCVDGIFTEQTFSTEAIDCLPVLTAGDNPQTITEVPNTVTSSIIVDPIDSVSIKDVNVQLDVTHTYVGDLTITLTSPNGTIVNLTAENCGANQDIDATFNDGGIVLECGTTAPTLSGDIQPVQNLSAFSGEESAGEWILTVDDGANGDGGSLNNFSLEFCTEQNVLGILDAGLDQFVIFPNPTSDNLTIQFNNAKNSVGITLFDISGRVVLSENVEANGQFNHTMSVANMSSGVYFVSVENDNVRTTRKLVID